MRALNWLNLNDVIIVVVEAAFEIEHFGFKRAHQDGEGLLIHARCHSGVDPKTLMLDESSAAADADRQAAAAKMVEHANFFVKAQRVIERQDVHQWAKPDFSGALDRRGQKNAGARGHPERRRMVLREVVGLEARLLDQREHTQAIFEKRA